jgi:hypothetical protein
VKRPARKSSKSAATPVATPAAGAPAGTTKALPLRRWTITGVVVVSVLGAAGAVGAVVRAHDATQFVAPTGAGGQGSFAVPVKGSPAVTLTVYEDMRDPASAAFATAYDPTLSSLVSSGTVTLMYREIAGVDASQGGTGSLQAGNALGCAQDADHFAKYRTALLKNQPAESDDAYATDANLFKLAKKVKGLDTDVFRSCVTSGDHKVWVKDSTADFTAAGLGSAPVLQLQSRHDADPTTMIGNGKQLTPQQLTAAVIAAAMALPSPTPSPSGS